MGKMPALPQGALVVAVMPRAELVLVAGCGHWLPVEAPDVFLTAVHDFLLTLT